MWNREIPSIRKDRGVQGWIWTLRSKAIPGTPRRSMSICHVLSCAGEINLKLAGYQSPWVEFDYILNVSRLSSASMKRQELVGSFALSSRHSYRRRAEGRSWGERIDNCFFLSP